MKFEKRNKRLEQFERIKYQRHLEREIQEGNKYVGDIEEKLLSTKIELKNSFTENIWNKIHKKFGKTIGAVTAFVLLFGSNVPMYASTDSNPKISILEQLTEQEILQENESTTNIEEEINAEIIDNEEIEEEEKTEQKENAPNLLNEADIIELNHVNNLMKNITNDTEVIEKVDEISGEKLYSLKLEDDLYLTVKQALGTPAEIIDKLQNEVYKGEKVGISLNRAYIGHSWDIPILNNSAGHPVYCVDGRQNVPTNGGNWSFGSVGGALGGAYNYVYSNLNYGYPSNFENGLIGSAFDQQLGTGSSIWYNAALHRANPSLDWGNPTAVGSGGYSAYHENSNAGANMRYLIGKGNHVPSATQKINGQTSGTVTVERKDALEIINGVEYQVGEWYEVTDGGTVYFNVPAPLKMQRQTSVVYNAGNHECESGGKFRILNPDLTDSSSYEAATTTSLRKTGFLLATTGVYNQDLVTTVSGDPIESPSIRVNWQAATGNVVIPKTVINDTLNTYTFNPTDYSIEVFNSANVSMGSKTFDTSWTVNFDGLLAGTYTWVETNLDANVKIVQGTGTFTIVAGETTTVTSANGAINELMGGFVESTKNRQDDTLNQNYNWDHTKLSIRITGNGVNKTYPLNSNFYFKSDKLALGTYNWQELNTDGGTVTVIGSGTFTITADDQTVTLTGNNAPTNKVGGGFVESTKNRQDDTLNQNYNWDHTKLSIRITGNGVNKTYPLNSNFYFKSDKLALGTYNWQELNTDGGTVTVIGSGTFTITADDQTVTLTGNNAPTNKVGGGFVETTKILINNSTEPYTWNHTKLSIRITGNGVDKTYPLDSNFYFRSDKLKLGTYNWQEINNDAGTVTVIGNGTFTVTTDEQVVTLQQNNTPTNEVAFVNLQLRKIDAEFLTAILKPSAFAVYDYDPITGVIGAEIMQANANMWTAVANFNNIQVGPSGERTVIVKELTAPQGYFLDENGIILTLTTAQHAQTIAFDYPNVPEKFVQPELIKYDELGNVLGGIPFKFERLDTCGGTPVELIETIITNDLGFTRFKLVPANDKDNNLICYRITEIRNESNKYFVLADPIEFTKPQDATVIMFNPINVPKEINLPIHKVAENNIAGITSDGSVWGLYDQNNQLIDTVTIQSNYAELPSLTYHDLGDDISKNYWQEITPGNDALILDTSKYHLPATDWMDIENGDSILVEGNTALTPFINKLKHVQYTFDKVDENNELITDESISFNFVDDVSNTFGIVASDTNGTVTSNYVRVDYVLQGLGYAEEITTRADLQLNTTRINLPILNLATINDLDTIVINNGESFINYFKTINYVLYKTAEANNLDLTADGAVFHLFNNVDEKLAEATVINGEAFFTNIRADKITEDMYVQEQSTLDYLVLDQTKIPVPNINWEETLQNATIEINDRDNPFINKFKLVRYEFNKADENNELITDETVEFDFIDDNTNTFGIVASDTNGTVISNYVRVDYVLQGLGYAEEITTRADLQLNTTKINLPILNLATINNLDTITINNDENFINYFKTINYVLYKAAEANPLELTADGATFYLFNNVDEKLAEATVIDGEALFIDIRADKVTPDMYVQEQSTLDWLILDQTKIPVPSIDWETTSQDATIKINNQNQPFINKIKRLKISNAKVNEYGDSLESVIFGIFAEDTVEIDEETDEVFTATQNLVQKMKTDAEGIAESDLYPIWMFDGIELQYIQELATLENLDIITKRYYLPNISVDEYGNYDDEDTIWVHDEIEPMINYYLRLNLGFYKMNEDKAFLPGVEYGIFDEKRQQLATVISTAEGLLLFENIRFDVFINYEDQDAENTLVYVGEIKVQDEDKYVLDYQAIYLPNLYGRQDEFEMNDTIWLNTKETAYINNYLRGEAELVKVDEYNNELLLPNATFLFERSSGEYENIEAELQKETTSELDEENLSEDVGELLPKTEYIDVAQNFELITDAEGKINVEDLLYGDWCVTEVKSPAGYILPVDENGLPNNQLCFTIDAKTQKVEMKFYNEKEPEILIETGENNSQLGLLIGFITMLISIILLSIAVAKKKIKFSKIPFAILILVVTVSINQLPLSANSYTTNVSMSRSGMIDPIEAGSGGGITYDPIDRTEPIVGEDVTVIGEKPSIIESDPFPVPQSPDTQQVDDTEGLNNNAGIYYSLSDNTLMVAGEKISMNLIIGLGIVVVSLIMFGARIFIFKKRKQSTLK